MTKQDFYSLENTPYLDPATNRRVAVVTGGNSGIGWYDCLHLYLHGWVVYVAGRNEQKVTTAIQKIVDELKDIVAKYPDSEIKNRPVGSLTFVRADFTDLASCEEAAKELLLKEKLIHLLILNAGVMALPLQFTKDNLEIQYQTNVTSQFLLTLRLLPALKAVAEQGKVVPRIVFLSSLAHTMTRSFKKPGDKSLFSAPNFYNTWMRYSQSKLADIHLAKQFAQRYPNILTSAVHPGVIVDTELYNHWKTLPVIGIFARGFIGLTGRVMGVTQEEGCLSTMRAATDPSLTLEKDNGKYYDAGGPQKEPTAIASNTDDATYTWNWNLLELKGRGYDVEDV